MESPNFTNHAITRQTWPTDTPVPDDADTQTLRLDLEITDPDLTRALGAYPEGRARREFALTALRIGVLALRQARGQLDSATIRQEGERLMADLGSELKTHRERLSAELGSTLTAYFDPASGRFSERVDRLLKKDGELETVLRSQLGEQDSQLARTLTAHVGTASPLMQVLDPNASTGLLQSLRSGIDKALAEDRERIVAQFSLDNSASALSRLVEKITDANGQLTKDMQGSLSAVVKEFSLDSEDSALSRLVRQVDQAQLKISREFSLDSDSSALARMKAEMLKVLDEHRRTNSAFQQEVREALVAMQARRDEASRSTTHGDAFEAQLYGVVQARAQKAGDIAAHVGNTTGVIRHNKKGDITLELGPEHVAAGTRIVIEAKEDSSYDLTRARTELDEARKNRDAEVGLFVFSRRTAPDGLQPLARYGHNVLCVWDADDEASDVCLDAALSLCRALCSKAVV